MRYLIILLFLLLFSCLSSSTDNSIIPVIEKLPEANITNFEMLYLADNKYNPELCVAGIKEYPSISFEVTETCDVKLYISTYGVSKIWSLDLKDVPRGKDTIIFDWDGNDSAGNQVGTCIWMYMSTYRQSSYSDDNKSLSFVIDRDSPEFWGTGLKNYKTSISTIRPFFIEYQLTEDVEGELRIFNKENELIDVVVHKVEKPEDASSIVRFEWNVHSIDSCDTFIVEPVFWDIVGNVIDTTTNRQKSFRTYSGGITDIIVNFNRDTITPLSEKPTTHFVMITILASTYCEGMSTYCHMMVFDNDEGVGDTIYSDDVLFNGSGGFSWNGKGSDNQLVSPGDYYYVVEVRDLAGYTANTLNDASYSGKLTVDY